MWFAARRSSRLLSKRPAPGSPAPAFSLLHRGATWTLPLLPDSVLDTYLADDVTFLDLTTHALAIGGKPGRMTFSARNAMVVACIEEAGRMISRADAEVELHAASGDAQAAGALLLSATGIGSGAVSHLESGADLVEVASGIATTTRAIVEAARACRSPILRLPAPERTRREPRPCP